MQNKVVYSKIRLLKIVPHDNLNKSNKKEEEINELKQRKKLYQIIWKLIIKY